MTMTEVYEHGGDRLSFFRKYNIPESEIIDFSTNINPLGFPGQLHRIINENIENLRHYPDYSYAKLKKSLSAYFDIPHNNIVCGNGSIELIYLCASVLKHSDALIFEPNFSEYRKALAACETRVHAIEGQKETQYKPKLEEILPSLTNVDIVFLSNPNNPAGYLYSREELLTLIKEAQRSDTILFVDEAFIDFVSGSRTGHSILDLVPGFENLIVLSSLTKNLALPGLRLGFLAASESLCSRLFAIQPPWSINVFAAAVGEEIALFDDYLRKTSQLVTEWKNLMLNEIERIEGLKVYPSFANYLLCELHPDHSVQALQDYLGRSGIMIRNASNYKGLDERHFRISVKEPEKNKRLLRLIKQFLEEDI